MLSRFARPIWLKNERDANFTRQRQWDVQKKKTLAPGRNEFGLKLQLTAPSAASGFSQRLSLLVQRFLSSICSPLKETKVNRALFGWLVARTQRGPPFAAHFKFRPYVGPLYMSVDFGVWHTVPFRLPTWAYPYSGAKASNKWPVAKFYKEGCSLQSP